MSRASTKRPTAPRQAPRAAPVPAKPAPLSSLRAQTRRVLGKHYRSKYGVR